MVCVAEKVRFQSATALGSGSGDPAYCTALAPGVKGEARYSFVIIKLVLRLKTSPN